MSDGNAPEFGISQKVNLSGRIDLAGGGQAVVENGYAYVGHMDPSHGTSILDIKDPKHLNVVAHIEIPRGAHSHKVWATGDIMLVHLGIYQGCCSKVNLTGSNGNVIMSPIPAAGKKPPRATKSIAPTMACST